jgi:type IV secretory pathway VirB10-like protein
MDQQYPQQPQQPNWGQQPTQPGYGYPPQQPYGQPPFQPQPPKKRNVGKIIGITASVFVGLIVIGAIAGGGNDSAKDDSSKDKAVAATSDKPKAAAEEPATDDKPAEKPAEDKSQAEQFKDCVNKSGTAPEKTAVGHVTKVTGADKNNDILDAAEVFTDFKGGFMSENNGDAKLIASAFASCYESKNGLVTVYGSDGDMISNGNY